MRLAAVLGTFPQGHESVGVGVRQRAEEHGVDDAEDGGVGADSDRQREHRRGNERRLVTQSPGSVDEVLPE